MNKSKKTELEVLSTLANDGCDTCVGSGVIKRQETHYYCHECFKMYGSEDFKVLFDCQCPYCKGSGISDPIIESLYGYNVPCGPCNGTGDLDEIPVST